MSLELKIKSKHLSVEAKIIRFEEQKLKRQIDWLKTRQQGYVSQLASFMSLNSHRRRDVRHENRATFLARAYLAGMSYNQVEQKRKEDIVFITRIVPRVVDMVNKYKSYNSPKVTRDTIYTWADV